MVIDFHGENSMLFLKEVDNKPMVENKTKILS